MVATIILSKPGSCIGVSPFASRLTTCKPKRLCVPFVQICEVDIGKS